LIQQAFYAALSAAWMRKLHVIGPIVRIVPE